MKTINDLNPKTKKIIAGIFFFAAVCLLITAIIKSTEGNGIDVSDFGLTGVFAALGSVFLIKDKNDKK